MSGRGACCPLHVQGTWPVHVAAPKNAVVFASFNTSTLVAAWKIERLNHLHVIFALFHRAVEEDLPVYIVRWFVIGPK